MAHKHAVGLFENYEDANAAVNELQEEGYDSESISVTAREATFEGYDTTDDTVADGATTGATLGGIAGLIGGIAAITVPGLGPVITAGSIAAALGTTAAGAATGGIVGVLVDLGFSDEEAEYYAEGVKRGGVLVTVTPQNGNMSEAKEILDNNSAVDVEEHVKHWKKEGWEAFEDEEPAADYPTL